MWTPFNVACPQTIVSNLHRCSPPLQSSSSPLQSPPPLQYSTAAMVNILSNEAHESLLNNSGVVPETITSMFPRETRTRRIFVATATLVGLFVLSLWIWIDTLPPRITGPLICEQKLLSRPKIASRLTGSAQLFLLRSAGRSSP